MALHHQTEGEGFWFWDEWSSEGSKYSGSEELQSTWESFGRYTGKPATARSLIKVAHDLGVDVGVAEADDFDELPPQVKAPVKVGTFNIRKHSDFMKEVRSVSWIVKDFVPHATLGVIFGESGSGKSFLTYDLCAAVVRGVSEWNGKRVRKGRVLYVVAEGQAGFINRGKAYVHQQGIQHCELDDMDYITDRVPNLMSKKMIDELIADIQLQDPYDLVVMDTFAQVTSGANENSGEHIGAALAECRRIGQASGAMVLLVHHSGKDSTKGARGWSGLRAAADLELEVLNSNGQRSVSVTKLKDGQDGGSLSFQLHTVVLGEDEDGDDITSCIVEYTGTKRVVPIKKEVLGPTEKRVLFIFSELLGLEPEGRVRIEDLMNKVLEEIPRPEAPAKDNRPTNIRRSMKKLVEKKKFSIDGEYAFLAEKDS